MSVTFETIDTEYEDVTEDGYTFSQPKEGYISINMANTNAADMLRLLGRNADAVSLCGSWDKEDMHNILRRLVKLKNIDNGSAFEKPTVVSGNMIHVGRDSDYVDLRVKQLMALLKDALNREVTVRFC